LLGSFGPVFEGDIDARFADEPFCFELHLLQSLRRKAIGELHDDGSVLVFSK